MESSQETSQQLISVVAAIWRERKDEISTATVSEAESIAQDEISVN